MVMMTVKHLEELKGLMSDLSMEFHLGLARVMMWEVTKDLCLVEKTVIEWVVEKADR